MKKNKSISDNIRTLREELGYTQEYMAIELNISQQAYSRIEKNPENTALSRLLEIAAVLKVSLNSLINENDAFIQNNFNQNGGHAASQMHLSSEKELYEKLVKRLEDENALLRSLAENGKETAKTETHNTR